jgi:O-antigen/teichoic acid export membrane protein
MDVSSVIGRLMHPRVIYALGSAANSAALLLLLPLLVGRLSREAYGLWALYEIAIVVGTGIVLIGLDGGLMREYRAATGPAARRRLVGTAVSLLLLWFVLLLILVESAAAVLRDGRCGGACAFLAPQPLTIGLLIIGADALFALLLSILRIRERAAAFAALSFMRLLLLLAMTGIALLFDGGLIGALLGRLAAVLITLPAAARLVRSDLSVAFDRATARQLLHYGLPLLPTNLALYVLAASDRFMLQAAASLEAVAIYTFAYKLASGLDVLVIRPYALDWAARRLTIADGPAANERYDDALVSYLLAACGGALLIAAAAPLGFALLAPAEYAAGLRLLPVLLAAMVLYGASYPLNIGMMLHYRTDLLPGLSWAAAGLCLLLNLWWIGSYGMHGAAWATLAGYAVYSLAVAIASNRLYRIHYRSGRLALIVMFTAIGAGGLAALARLIPATTVGGAVAGVLWAGAAAAAAALVTGRRLRPAVTREP